MRWCGWSWCWWRREWRTHTRRDICSPSSPRSMRCRPPSDSFLFLSSFLCGPSLSRHFLSSSSLSPFSRHTRPACTFLACPLSFCSKVAQRPPRYPAHRNTNFLSVSSRLALFLLLLLMHCYIAKVATKTDVLLRQTNQPITLECPHTPSRYIQHRPVTSNTVPLHPTPSLVDFVKER